MATQFLNKLGRNDPCHCGSGEKYKKCCHAKDSNAATSVPNFLDAKRELEQTMKKLSLIASQKDFNLEEFKEQLLGKSFDEIDADFDSIKGDNPKFQAEDLLWKTHEEPNRKKRLSMIKEALSLYPHLPDAYLLLAEEKAQTPAELLEYSLKAVAAGEADLGEKFIKENEGHFWGMHETRPYMRAKAQLADILWAMGKEDESIAHFEDCIRLNPNDNQGIRDALFASYLIRDNIEGAAKLLKQYNEDSGAAHAYNKALYLFKKHGAKSKLATKAMAEAMNENKYVPEFLLARKKMPSEIPGSFSFGSIEEAIIYTDLSMRAWVETDGAGAWLKDFLNKN